MHELKVGRYLLFYFLFSLMPFTENVMKSKDKRVKVPLFILQETKSNSKPKP